MEPRDFNLFLSADFLDGCFALAGIGTSQPATCREFPRDGNDPRSKAARSASLFEKESHVSGIERRKTFHVERPPARLERDCYVIIPRLRRSVRVESITVARKNPKEGV